MTYLKAVDNVSCGSRNEVELSHFLLHILTCEGHSYETHVHLILRELSHVVFLE